MTQERIIGVEKFKHRDGYVLKMTYIEYLLRPTKGWLKCSGKKTKYVLERRNGERSPYAGSI